MSNWLKAGGYTLLQVTLNKQQYDAIYDTLWPTIIIHNVCQIVINWVTLWFITI